MAVCGQNLTTTRCATCCETPGTIAVVGVSADPLRPSNGVYRYLTAATDYELYPVNPTIDELDGQPAYRRACPHCPWCPTWWMCSAAADQLQSVLNEAIAVGAKSIWLQQGLWDEQLARDAEAAGLAGGDGPLSESGTRPAL